MKRPAVVAILIIVGMILANCQRLTPTQEQETVTITVQTTQVVTYRLTSTTSVTPSPSLTPSKTITPTKLSYPTRTFTTTPAPTWTQLPTLSSAEAETKIMDLLVHNADCKLPCWWGITPGVTTWNEANHFLEAFTSIEEPFLQDIDDVLYKGYSPWFYLGKNKYFISLITVDEIVIEIVLTPDVTDFGHQLPSILSNNGVPDQIWIAPMPETPGGPWFYLVLYYPEQGILAEYSGAASLQIKTGSDGKPIITGINVCPVGIGPELWLKTPNTLSGVYDNPALGGPDFTSLLRQIDITGMNINDFYNRFRNADNTTCFVVPQ